MKFLQNQLLCVDSDDDQINENMSPISVDSHGYCRTQMGSLNSASNVARNEGLESLPLLLYLLICTVIIRIIPFFFKTCRIYHVSGSSYDGSNTRDMVSIIILSLF